MTSIEEISKIALKFAEESAKMAYPSIESINLKDRIWEVEVGNNIIKVDDSSKKVIGMDNFIDSLKSGRFKK